MGEGNRRQRVFFIDSENGIERLIEGCENLNPDDLVVVFIRGSVANRVQIALELSPAQIEWITCVDPKVKNSMDVQIITELSLRLASSGLTEGYIVSFDKGYNPALHYLQKHPASAGCELMLAPSISQALVHSITRALRDIEKLNDRDSITQTLSLILGLSDAERLVNRMAEVLATELAQQESDGMGVCAATGESFEQGASCDAGEGAEAAGSTTGFFGNEVSCLEQSEERRPAETLADLKGLGKTLSKKLKEVGISTPAKLREAGSVEAWRRIREADPSFSMRWLYMFEVAITGGTLGDIAAERKRQLKREAKRVG